MEGESWNFQLRAPDNCKEKERTPPGPHANVGAHVYWPDQGVDQVVFRFPRKPAMNFGANFCVCGIGSNPVFGLVKVEGQVGPVSCFVYLLSF